MSTEIRRGMGELTQKSAAAPTPAFVPVNRISGAHGVNFTAAEPAGTWDQDSSLKSGSLKKGGTLRTADRDVGCARVRLGAEIGISVRPTA